MVKIRLKRLGRKKRPFYRIVVTDIRTRREGVPLAELGYYDPISKQLKLDKTSAQEWLAKGAIPTDTAKRLIDRAGDTGELIQLERRVRAPKKAAAPAEEAAPAAAQVAPPAVVAEEAPAAVAEEAPPAAAEEEAPSAEAAVAE